MDRCWLCCQIRKQRKDNKTFARRHHPPAGLIAFGVLIMCDHRARTVRLHNSRRTFSCAYCARVREHPYFDYLYVRDYHAYCDYCGRWMEIENKITSKTEEENNAEREKKSKIT